MRYIMLADDQYKWIQNDDGSEEFYYLSDGNAETNNRIAVLDTQAQTIRAKFTEILRELENLPTIHQTYIDESNHFNIELVWYANASLDLEYRSDLSEGNWSSAIGFTLNDSGHSFLTLSHPMTGPVGFYQVTKN